MDLSEAFEEIHRVMKVFEKLMTTDSERAQSIIVNSMLVKMIEDRHDLALASSYVLAALIFNMFDDQQMRSAMETAVKAAGIEIV
jgi:hypothetical protein